MSERPSDGLLAWAAVGSRISGFHHDSASKLQSLMMALDEATELAGESRPDIGHALKTATTALRELHALLTENRALAKAPVRRQVALADILKRASARHGVKLRGEVGEATVHVALPSIVHALGLLCDSIAGPQQGTRGVEVVVTPADARITVALTGAAPPASALDAIMVATWLVEREDGAAFSAPNGFQVHLPTTARSAADKS